MKSKNATIALLITLVLVGITFAHVIAGASFDWGDLAPKPGGPVPGPGEVNWIAWTTQSLITGNIPYEILTEDNVNSDLGENKGYSEYGDGDTNMEWLIQIEHFLILPRNEPFNDPIYMIFGGLSPQYKGTLWKSEFPWIITESATYHGTTPIFTTEAPACPSMLDPIVGETTTLVRFWGQPGAKYHVYRSRNESGANNGKSNGQYFYLATLTADQGGNFQYTDDVTELNWYIAVQADPTTNAPIGCHSEPVEPTAAVLSGFTSSFDLETTSVDLSWETFSDANIMGFNVYRSDENSPVLVKINTETLLVYPPDGTEGNQYSFTDAGIEIGQTYTYWLDLIDLGGQTSRFGPVTQFAGFKVFVPIMQK